VSTRARFIPTEQEIDQLIAGNGYRIATLLQMLKETGMRIGEAWILQWNDIDIINKTVRVTPEKGSKPRLIKISTKLFNMLNTLHNDSDPKIFGSRWLKSQRRLYTKQRTKIANKLKNPRIRRITFHTFRHWKAATEYHKTLDIVHVKRLLGHKNINSTLLYTQLIDTKNDEYIVRIAHTIEEDKQLIESGFEYITDRDGDKIYRKRK